MLLWLETFWITGRMAATMWLPPSGLILAEAGSQRTTYMFGFVHCLGRVIVVYQVQLQTLLLVQWMAYTFAFK